MSRSVGESEVVGELMKGCRTLASNVGAVEEVRNVVVVLSDCDRSGDREYCEMFREWKDG